MSYQPLYRSRPGHRWTNGDIAAKVGADLGLPPDDEQRWILDTIYAEKGPDRPASFEVCVISPRQNIKTSTLGTAALADLFVFGVHKHLWSAHLDDTAKKTFADFQRWIRANPEYEERVQFYEGHQDRSIVLRDTGASIEFGSRSGKASRGATGVERVTIDEALFLEPKHIGAIYPTMLTRPGAQLRIASSAGIEMSRELRRIRDRGRAGKDPRLAYIEFGAERRACARGRTCSHEVGVEGCALDDRELWWQANCALWAGRVDEEAIDKLRGSMPPEEFMREMFSWWEDPESIGGALPVAVWDALADPSAERGALVAFGADVAEDRRAWVAVAWTREDGGTQVMLANDGEPLHPDSLVEECARLTAQWGGVAVPPKAFEDEFASTVDGTYKLPMGGFTMACGMVADRVAAGTIRHGNQAPLNEAVKAAKWRSAGAYGERAFQLKDFPQVGPLAAVVRAVYGLTQAASEPSAIY